MRIMKSKNYILSIGVDNYASGYWRNLSNAVFDAQHLKNILVEKYSYEGFPSPLYNEEATNSEIFTSFNTINQILTKEDSLVIFFAGHGNMDPQTRKGFWIPSEGTLDRSTWIENSSIKNFLSDCPAKHILLIIDSCFSGTFLTTTRDGNVEKSYSDLNSKKSRWVISSGSEEKVSDGIPREHSPFCKKIIHFLSINDNENFSVSELFNYTRLLISTTNTQKPQCNYIDNIGHEDGELIFTLSDNIKTKIRKTIGIPNSELLKREYLSNISAEEKLASGKEILIVKSIISEKDFIILENFRFDDFGNKKIKFKDDVGVFDLDNPENNLKIIRRFATVMGLTNYLDKNPELLSGKVAYIEAHPDIEFVEEKLYCISYSQYLIQLFESNKKQMHCLHCDEKITDNNSYMIEFDDYGFPTAVGNVHNNCLRPIDRILGRSVYQDINESNYLKNFDFDKWRTLLENGQGQLTGLFKNDNLPNINVLSWNPENNLNAGSYCIKINYDNGDTQFVMLGKKIQRFSDNEIDIWMEKFTTSIKTDKFCKIVESGTYGSEDLLKEIKKSNETISYVTSYEKVKYSKLFESDISTLINDYTPLCYFTNSNNELLEIDDLTIFITNPQIIDFYIKNWENFTVIKNKFRVRIVESDLELGNLISVHYKNNKKFVINPFFNLTTNSLKSGLVIENIEEIIKHSPKFKTNLKKGDKVSIMINPEAEKLPYGIVLEDPFVDDTGEICAFFSPIENDEVLDLVYIMPLKLLRKIIL